MKLFTSNPADFASGQMAVNAHWAYKESQRAARRAARKPRKRRPKPPTRVREIGTMPASRFGQGRPWPITPLPEAVVDQLLR